MVFLVPYDGSPVSEAALDRAVEHGKALETEVVAVTFIPTGAEYAQRRKWIQPEEDFAIDSARAELKRKIDETTDESERNFLDSGATVENGVGDHIRQAAHEVEASTVYVGAAEETDTEYRTPFGEITTDESYDLHLVRSY
ncbi:Universal stress protein family protein [Halovenus aranensis]|uniref:Universal stress protein family protein n=1 Tax=Halovenus aranensis TaxID=890420 RepID=A0A1G8W9D5_9EURY|nr:universal stress protein [Halovenus aranensis]SDJ74727.1 Universal stress protein family protein [Halovenus aranensis]